MLKTHEQPPPGQVAQTEVECRSQVNVLEIKETKVRVRIKNKLIRIDWCGVFSLTIAKRAQFVATETTEVMENASYHPPTK